MSSAFEALGRSPTKSLIAIESPCLNQSPEDLLENKPFPVERRPDSLNSTDSSRKEPEMPGV